MLTDVEELTYKEVADALGISVNLVMARLLRARKTLRTELAAYINKREDSRDEERTRNLLPFASRARG